MSGVLDVGSGCRLLGDVNLDIDENVPSEVHWDLNILPLPFKNMQFRKVYCYHVLEHLDKPERVLDELVRVSKMVEVRVPHIHGTMAMKDKSHKHTFDEKWFKDYAKSRNLNVGASAQIDCSRFLSSITNFYPLEIWAWLWRKTK